MVTTGRAARFSARAGRLHAVVSTKQQRRRDLWFSTRHRRRMSAGGAGSIGRGELGYMRSMTDDTERTLMSAVRLTLTVLGLGLLASLAAGVVVGLIIDDIGRGIGQTVAVGMAVTAVIGVALNILFRGGQPRR